MTNKTKLIQFLNQHKEKNEKIYHPRYGQFFFRHVNDKKNSLFHNDRRKINGFEC
jgi:hypothetical protein